MLSVDLHYSAHRAVVLNEGNITPRVSVLGNVVVTVIGTFTDH